MFIENGGTWLEKNTKTARIKCQNCGNTADNVVVGAFAGPHIGFIFLSKNKHLGKKAYFLCCPVCSNANKELSTEELEALKN